MTSSERDYRIATKSAIESSIKELEERNKRLQTMQQVERSIASINNNIAFAQKLKLIDSPQVYEYQRRLVQIQKDFEELQRTEILDAVNDYENHRERATRFSKMDTYNADISKKKSIARERGR